MGACKKKKKKRRISPSSDDDRATVMCLVLTGRAFNSVVRRRHVPIVRNPTGRPRATTAADAVTVRTRPPLYTLWYTRRISAVVGINKKHKTWFFFCTHIFFTVHSFLSTSTKHHYQILYFFFFIRHVCVCVCEL